MRNGTDRTAQHTEAITPNPAELYDVAIIGRHLAGGLLATVLSAQRLRVLLVGSAADAVEPAGETTVPYTAEVFLLLAKRFGVPEISAFGLFGDLPAEVRSMSGVKGSLGFLYHHPGQRHDAAESVQFHVPGEHGEWHLYRPVVDQYAVDLAARYGAAIDASSDVVDADADESGAWLQLRNGHRYRSRFLVDCAGADSPLVARHGGFEQSPWLRHRSVVYTAHLAGLQPFEEISSPARAGRRRDRNSPWGLGTVHHIFPGGWMQLAAFDNHPASRNDLVSATLSIAPGSALAAGLPAEPEQAVTQLLARFPDIREQFRDARLVRKWQVEPDFQRTAATTCGPRWFAFERSASRNDMFLSRDVTMTGELVHALASTLIPAALTDNFDPARLASVAEFQRQLVDFNDRLLCGARTATLDFRLWNAYVRVWLLWQILADLSLKRARLDAEANPSTGWASVEEFERGGIWFHVPAGLPELINRSLAVLDDVAVGVTDPASAANAILGDLRRSPIVPPLYAFGNPAARVYRFTLAKRLRMLWWTKTSAPSDFRRLLTRDNVTSVTSSASR